jgi:chaperonin GroES
MIKALGHHVLVKVNDVEEKTAGGIVIPSHVRDTEKRAAEIGLVIDIGPTAWAAEGLGGKPWAEVGDKVWFAKYAGKWVQEEGSDEELLILNDVDLMCKAEA